MHVHVVDHGEGFDGRSPVVVYGTSDDSGNALLLPRRIAISTDPEHCDEGCREDEAPCPWIIEMLIDVDDETRAHVVERLEIRRAEGGPPVSASNVRGVPVGGLVKEALRQSVMILDGRDAERSSDEDAWTVPAVRWADTGVPIPDRLLRRLVTGIAGSPSRRRNRVTPQARASALRTYEAAKDAGEPNAIELVMEKHQLGRASAYNWIKQAREERDR